MIVRRVVVVVVVVVVAVLPYDGEIEWDQITTKPMMMDPRRLATKSVNNGGEPSM
jgi:hypothetical protein